MKIYKRTLDVKSGTEGPKYDPYAFQEYTIRVNKNVFSLHLGLAVFLKVNGEIKTDIKQEAVVEEFERLVGLTVPTFERSFRKLHTFKFCPKCGSSKLNWECGFPGEELLMCEKCNVIVTSSFNEGAII